MSEKSTKFERPPIPVFGSVDSLFPEEEKQKVSEEFGGKFSEGEFTELSDKALEDIKTQEYDKRPYELEFIEKSSEITNRLREKYGLAGFDLSPRNIHILPPELFKKIYNNSSAVANHDPYRQVITANSDGLRYQDNRVSEASSIFHETIHLKSYVSLDIDQKEDKKRRSIRRLGLTISEGYDKADKDEWYESFRGLNEAVVSELEQRYADEVAQASSDPETQDEIKWLASKEALELKKKAVENKSFTEDEIKWISKDGERWLSRSYREHRRILKYIVGQVAEDAGESTEKVYELFFKAHFTGNILEITKLIESTFGPGQFRALGMMSSEESSANQMLDYLKKQRIRMGKKESHDS